MECECDYLMVVGLGDVLSCIYTENKYHVILCLWLVEKKIIKKKYDDDNNPKLYYTHQFLSACFQFHITMLMPPVCMQ